MFLTSLPNDPRQWGDTAFWPAFAFFLIWVGAVLGVLGECYWTKQNTAKQWITSNPLNKFLYNKFNNITLVSFLEGMAMLIIGGVLISGKSYIPGDVFLGVVAALEVVFALKNKATKV